MRSKIQSYVKGPWDMCFHILKKVINKYAYRREKRESNNFETPDMRFWNSFWTLSVKFDLLQKS